MLEIFKRKDDREQNDSESTRFSTVSARAREALRLIEEKKQIGKLALLKRKRAEMQRAKGLGSGIGVEERLFRADFDNALLKSGVHIMIDALQAEIQIHEKSAADFAEVFKAAEPESEKLSAEIAELNRKRDQLFRDTIEARTRCVRATTLVAERSRELESYLEFAEGIARGADLKLWKPRDPNLQLLRQPIMEFGVAVLPEYNEGRITQQEAEKRVAQLNRNYRALEQGEWDEANRAFELQIPVADLQFMESNDKEAA